MQNYSNNKIPKHLQVYDWFLGMVKRKRISIGDQIPTETEIATQFNINRMTVRKALDRLVTEGMINRRRGQGSFLISELPKDYIYNLDITTGFSRDMRNYGIEPRTENLAVEVVQANNHVTAILELNHDIRVIRTNNIYFAKDIPVMIETNYMPYQEFKELLNMDLSKFRYALLKEQYQITPHRNNQTFSAVLSNDNETHLFGFNSPQACILLEYTAYDEVNIPFEISYCLYRGDKYKFNSNAIEFIYSD